MLINLRKLICWLACLSALVCWLPPTAQAGIISTRQEIKLGQDVAQQLEKRFGLVDDPALQARVAEIGARIVAVSNRQDIKYSFKVLNTNEINALALPGGFVYLFKGLIDYMPSDDELAAVIGHEVAHITERHTVKQIEKNLAVSLIFGVVFGDRAALLQHLAFNAIMAGYSRDDEREADRFGFYYALKGGFNPYGMEITQLKLAALTDTPNYGLFSSHPEPERRIALLQRYAQEANIRPQVKTGEDGAYVVDDQWQLPPFKVEAHGYQALHRAYLCAGNLYRVSQRQNLSPDWLILANEGDEYSIYYDDIKIVTLTMQDAVQAGMPLIDLANRYIFQISNWLRSRGQV